MRTKTLLAAAVMLAAGLASSMAQSNVYSLNVVGYVNTPLIAGFNLISSPLNTTSNTLNGVFTAPGFGDTIYKHNGSTFDISTYVGTWSPDLPLKPGEGVFYLAGAPLTNTFVGEVLQGSLTNPIPANFSIRSSQVPQAGTLSELNFPAGFGDTAYFFRGTPRAYVISTFVGTWSPDLTNAVGEAFWINAGTAANWTRNFTVQ